MLCSVIAGGAKVVKCVLNDFNFGLEIPKLKLFIELN